MVARAIHIAESGTPGATVLVLPENVLETQLIPPSPIQRWRGSPDGPSHLSMELVEELLLAAQKPLLIVGSRVASLEGRLLLQNIAEQHYLPVITSNKRQDLFNNRHQNYAGHLNIATQERQRHLLAQADLILAIGTRLDFITTQRYTFPQAPIPAQKLIHVYPDAEQLGFIYQPSLGLTCEPIAFLHALSSVTVSTHIAQRKMWIEQLHTFEIELATWHKPSDREEDLLGQVVSVLNDLVPPNSIFTVDAGNFTSWVHRYFRFGNSNYFLGISSSAMGFGVPAGVAAALRYPERLTITFVGDGGFLMNGNELATAVQRKTRLLIIIANNNSYGTIRQHQERSYPGRVVATDLYNPDFEKLALAYNVPGFTINSEAEIIPILKQAVVLEGPVIVNVKTSLAWISAYSYLSALESRLEQL